VQATSALLFFDRVQETKSSVDIVACRLSLVAPKPSPLMRQPILVLILLAACGPKEPVVISNTPASIAEASFADSLGIDLEKFDTNASGLYWRDLVVGDGPVVRAGQVVSVNYDGRFPDGRQFDASDPGDPIQFPIGVRRVIDGWDQGVVGMHVGGKRQLIIPPALGYGATGAGGGVIPPNATLVFTVEVVGAQ
jgi:FKBP-type peptidyl-prolyl cis-trans isomerase FkpA